jgi:ribosomal protein S18 acetylase RimI-like enzyme
MDELIFKLASKQFKGAAAAFIACRNAVHENHIGYCGTKLEEITAALNEDLTDVPFEQSFILVYLNTKLVGLLGFDADLNNRSVELWGPFHSGMNQLSIHVLFEKMMELLPQGIDRLCMFPNKENSSARRLAEQFSFSKKSEQTVLNFDKAGLHKKAGSPALELTPLFTNDMILLHDLAFPDTYYNGRQIVSRMNSHRKVFIRLKNEELAGYIYVEAEPEFGEASIEFFAVQEKFRGEGIGAALLEDAVHWIFSFENMHSIQLCVNSANESAIRLYQRIGFQIKHELDYYEKKLETSI